jgi:hypothetical protein
LAGFSNWLTSPHANQNLQTGSAHATIFAVFGKDLDSLHFLFANFYFFLNHTWVLSKSKLVTF